MLRADFSRRMMSYVAIAHRVSFVTYNNCARTMSFTTTKSFDEVSATVQQTGGAAPTGNVYQAGVSLK
jgi:hypothetical protein